MPVKRVNVDDLLGENQLELTLGGKPYIVDDVPMNVFLASTKEVEGMTPEKQRTALHTQLAVILGVDVSELEGIGFKKVGLAIRAIRDWMFESAGISIDASESENP